MRLIILGFYFYFVNCAAKSIEQNARDVQLSGPESKRNITQSIEVAMSPSQSIKNYREKTNSYSAPFKNGALKFTDSYKECLMQSPVITILFNDNEVMCDGARELVNKPQSKLIDRSKNYVLKQFHFFNKKEVLDMIKLPDSQFNITIFDKLEEAGFDPHKASEHGIRFVQNHQTNFGTSVMESFIHYYWSFAPIHNEFLDRMFKSLASTLTTQEYFEFEALLDWINSKYKLIDEVEYEKVRVILKRHYTVPWNSHEYLKAWYSMRPLEGETEEKSEPIRSWSY